MSAVMPKDSAKAGERGAVSPLKLEMTYLHKVRQQEPENDLFDRAAAEGQAGTESLRQRTEILLARMESTATYVFKRARFFAGKVFDYLEQEWG